METYALKALVVCLAIFEVVSLLSPGSFLYIKSLPRIAANERSPIWHEATNDEGEAREVYTATNRTASESAQPICRIVTRADSKLPTSPSCLPSNLSQSPRLLNKLDTYYNAKAHRTTQGLDYLYQEKTAQPKQQGLVSSDKQANPQHEEELVGVLRNSLEDAGFELLNRRDIDLCDALNAGYLLRLSIVPDVSALDESIALEFYSERFHSNGSAIDEEELLFDGRVLVYWRGYSAEVTQGRLILPKLDYLQASIVQGAAAWVKRRLDTIENTVAQAFSEKSRKLRQMAEEVVEMLPVGNAIPKALSNESIMEGTILPGGNGRFNLGRYGGSKVRFVGSPNHNNALEPFTICEVPNDILYSTNETIAFAEHEMRDEINHNVFTCAYDAKMGTHKEGEEPTRMELLERVSINNLVDLYTGWGRRKVVQALFEKSELVEPTYEEVVVVWRPKIKKRPEFRPPKFISDLADILDVEGLQQPTATSTMFKQKGKLEIRTFQGVPMANLPAVLPKTKLVFRPADAFLFDMISFATFVLVVGSIRLDSPRLDLLALVSVTLWIVRTVFRYSNKLASYDLLVKKFLTSKISHRNVGALKYIASEAGAQRAVRAALVHYWLSNFVGAIKAPFQRQSAGATLTRSNLREMAQDEINNILKVETQVQMHVERSLHDLEDLRMLKFDSEDQETLVEVLDPATSVNAVKAKWSEFFDEDTEDDSPAGGNATDTILPGKSPILEVSDNLDEQELGNPNASLSLIDLF